MRGVTPQTPYVPGPFPVRPEEPFTLQQMAPRRSSRWVFWLVVGLVVLGLAGTGAAWLVIRDTPAGGSSDSALVDACQDAVRGKLVAPSTARFPGGDRIEQEGSTWRVFGRVDAQNRFGAMLREDYRCVAVREGDGWDVYFVEVLD